MFGLELEEYSYQDIIVASCLLLCFLFVASLMITGMTFPSIDKEVEKYLFKKKYIYKGTARKTKKTKLNHTPVFLDEYCNIELYKRCLEYDLLDNRIVNFVDECGKCISHYTNKNFSIGDINIIVKFNKTKKNYKKIFRYAKKDNHKIIKDVPYEIINMIGDYI